MNSLYYTLNDRKSIKTLRLEYGQLGLKFVLRMFDGQIDRRGDREGLPKVTQTSFLRTDLGEDGVSFKFDSLYPIDIA